MPPKYDDLYKPLKDLLSKQYSGSNRTFEFKTKNKNESSSVECVAKCEDVQGKEGRTSKGELSMELSDTYKFPVKIKATGKTGSKTEAQAKMSVSDWYSKGTKAEFTFDSDLAAPGADKWSVVGECSRDKFVGKVTYDSSGKLVANGVMNFQDINGGAQFTFPSLGGTSPSAMSLAGQVDHSGMKVVGVWDQDLVDGNKSSFKCGATGTLPSKWKWGGQFEYKMGPKKTVISVGVEGPIAQGKLKAKMDTEKVISVALQQEVGTNLKLAYSMECADGKPKWGVAVNYDC